MFEMLPYPTTSQRHNPEDNFIAIKTSYSLYQLCSFLCLGASFILFGQNIFITLYISYPVGNGGSFPGGKAAGT
jgi:hypothetical protein